MISFTFNEQTHLGWNIYNSDELTLAQRGIAFIVFLEPRGSHHFQDGDFRLRMNTVQKNVSMQTPAGPVLFAMKTPTATVLLFQTKDNYILDHIPTQVQLIDSELQFFDLEATRELIGILKNRPLNILLQFQDVIFQLAKSTEEERLRLSAGLENIQ